MYKDLKKTIITTAFRLFKEKGYDATTINDICAACEITKPTFYRHVASKEEILAYCFYSINDETSTLLISLTREDNYYLQILAAFDLIIGKMKKLGRDLYSQLYISNLKNNYGTFEDISTHRELVTLLIKKAQEHKQIRNTASPEKLYEVCASLCFGCGIQWCLGKIDEDIDIVFRRMLSTALGVDNPQA